MTQDELGAASGVSARTIRALESGSRRAARLSTVRCLADALSLDDERREALLVAAAGEAESSVDGVSRQAVPAGVGRSVLPRDLPDFFGRDIEKAQLLRLAEQHDGSALVICAIDGMAGVGKTTLAVHVAHALATRYPDGQLLCDLHGYTPGRAPAAAEEALDELLRMVGVPGERIPLTLTERVSMWRTVATGRRLLVVLDNAASAEQVAPLLPGSAQCLFLITSRRRLQALDGAATVALDVLPVPDAVALFTQVAGIERGADHRDAVASIVALCGQLPLAIRIAAARLAHRPGWTPEVLAARLRDTTRRLAELTVGERGVATAFTMSYGQLDPDHQRMFRLLALNPGHDITPHAAAALADTDPATAETLLENLVDHHMVITTAPGRYTFHDLLRDHARATSASTDPEESRTAALTRLLDYQLHLAAAAMDLIEPQERHLRPDVRPSGRAQPEMPDAAAAARWLDAEREGLIASAMAADTPRPRHVGLLSAVMGRWLDDRGHYQDAVALHSCAIRLPGNGTDPMWRAQSLRCLGVVYWRWGRLPEAAKTFAQAIELFQQAECAAGEALTLGNIGNLHRRWGNYDQAVAHYDRALAVARSCGDQAVEARMLGNLGVAYWWLGRYEDAASHHRQALALARKTGDRLAEARTIHNLGSVYTKLDQCAKAIEHHNLGLALARDAGDYASEAHALIGLGNAFARSGRHLQAIAQFEQGRDLARDIGERNLEADAVLGLGETTLLTGDVDQACAHLFDALARAEDLGDRRSQARAHSGLAHAYLASHRPQLAHEHRRNAAELFDCLGIGNDDIEGDLL
jgi:tetratricopeptide (TPR) repeat protein/transcriptional regulator with XRE-family HTH domain